MKQATLKNKILLAIKAVQKNPNFLLISSQKNEVIKSIARLIEFVTLDLDIYVAN